MTVTEPSLATVDELNQNISAMLAAFHQDSRPHAAKELSKTLVDLIVDDRRATKSYLIKLALDRMPEMTDIQGKYEGMPIQNIDPEAISTTMFEIDYDNPDSVNQVLKLVEDIGRSNALQEVTAIIETL